MLGIKQSTTVRAMQGTSFENARFDAKTLAYDFSLTGYIYLLPNGSYRASNNRITTWRLVEFVPAVHHGATTIVYQS